MRLAFGGGVKYCLPLIGASLVPAARSRLPLPHTADLLRPISFPIWDAECVSHSSIKVFSSSRVHPRSDNMGHGTPLFKLRHPPLTHANATICAGVRDRSAVSTSRFFGKFPK